MNFEDSSQVKGPQMAPHEERRRSQRVTLRVGVKLHANINGNPAVIRAFTANVNDHGALLLSPEDFVPGARFILENERSRKRMGCRVTRKPQASAAGFQVAVEFDEHVPGFWHISFPPTDWKVED